MTSKNKSIIKADNILVFEKMKKVIYTFVNCKFDYKGDEIGCFTYIKDKRKESTEEDKLFLAAKRKYLYEHPEVSELEIIDPQNLLLGKTLMSNRTYNDFSIAMNKLAIEESIYQLNIEDILLIEAFRKNVEYMKALGLNFVYCIPEPGLKSRFAQEENIRHNQIMGMVLEENDENNNIKSLSVEESLMLAEYRKKFLEFRRSYKVDPIKDEDLAEMKANMDDQTSKEMIIKKKLVLDKEDIYETSSDFFADTPALWLGFNLEQGPVGEFYTPYRHDYLFLYDTVKIEDKDIEEGGLPSSIWIENYYELVKYIDKPDALPDLYFMFVDGEKVLEENISLREFIKKYIFNGNIIEEYWKESDDEFDFEEDDESLASSDKEDDYYILYGEKIPYIQYYKTSNNEYVKEKYHSWYAVRNGEVVSDHSFWKIKIGYMEAEKISKEEFYKAVEQSKKEAEGKAK